MSENAKLAPVYSHIRGRDYYFDQKKTPKDSSWGEGVPGFYAFDTQATGTVPVYRHEYNGYYAYDLLLTNDFGWSKGIVCFYAYESSVPGTVPPGTVPVYMHNYATYSYYYDLQVENNHGWTPGVVAFYAVPPDPVFKAEMIEIKYDLVQTSNYENALFADRIVSNPSEATVVQEVELRTERHRPASRGG